MKALSRLRRWLRSAPRGSMPRRFQPQLDCLEDRCLPSATLGYLQINIASDVPALASVVDDNMINPWGISFSPTGPFWFSETGTSSSDLMTGSGQEYAYAVTFANASGSASYPTGTVFNGGTGFVITAGGTTSPGRFLFATADGDIYAWKSLDTPAATLVVDNSATGASYLGLALATDANGNSYLYAANFSQVRIDMFDENFQPVSNLGTFVDPKLPAGYSPYNVQLVGDKLYVTYALQDSSHPEYPSTGAGQGYVDVFDTSGNLLNRFASGGALDAPWGVTQAPASFGPYSGAILIGNNGDGRINAYDPTSGDFLGQLSDDSGNPIEIPGLWAITVGNGHDAGDANTVFFTAGSDYGLHGLFGAIQSPEHRGQSIAGDGIFDQNAPGEPGDYPLPPLVGPSTQDSVGSLGATTVAMPLGQSSALLAPTINEFAQVSTPAQTGTIAFVPLNPSTATSLLASTAVLSQSPVQPGIQSNGVALNTFLDLRVTPTFRGVDANAQEHVPEAITVAPRIKTSEFADKLLDKPLIEVAQAIQMAAPDKPMPVVDEPISSTVVIKPGAPAIERRVEPSRDEENAAGLVRYFSVIVWMPPVGGFLVKRLRRPRLSEENHLEAELPPTLTDPNLVS